LSARNPRLLLEYSHPQVFRRNPGVWVAPDSYLSQEQKAEAEAVDLVDLAGKAKLTEDARVKMRKGLQRHESGNPDSSGRLLR